MLALIIIVCILLFLFLLTVIPVRVELGFRQEFSLTLRYLFLTFHLLPGKGKEQEEEIPEEQETESTFQKIKKILKRQGFSGFLKSLFELVQMVASSSKRLLSHLRLRYFDLYVCLGGAGGAGDAALRYGWASGAVYSACGLLFSLMSCRKKSVSVDLDYQSPEDRVEFSSKVSILPLYVLKEGISLLIKGLPVVRKLMGTGARSKNEKERISQTRKQGERQ